MQDWSREDPGAGEVPGIRYQARLRAATAAQLRDAATRIESTVGRLAGTAWTGTAQQAFAGEVAENLAEHRFLTGSLEAQARALTVYAHALQQIQDDQHRLAFARIGLAQFSQGPQLEAQWEDLVHRRRLADHRCVNALTAPEVLGPLTAFTPHRIAHTTPIGLWQLLAGLSAGELTALLASEPELADRLRAADPTRVHTWWNTLNGPTAGAPSSTQDALIHSLPDVVGNLGGVPYWARDTANRHALELHIAEAEERLASATPQYRVLAKAQFDALRNIRSALDAKAGERQLVTLDLREEGLPFASISIGDVDTAGNVTFLVPGMGTDTRGITGWTAAAQSLYDEQGRVDDDRNTRAVVAWINYQTPPFPIDNTDVLRNDAALAGAPRVDRDLTALAAARADPYSLNLVAHSYGTTMTAVAAAQTIQHLDSIVFLGSAGVDRTLTATDLHADHVYAGQGRNVIPLFEKGQGDQAAVFGRIFSIRANPMNPSFGGATFGTNGTADLQPVTTHDVLPRDGYGYLSPQTESLRNTALATTGHGDDTTPHRDPGLTSLERKLLAPLFGSLARTPIVR